LPASAIRYGSALPGDALDEGGAWPDGVVPLTERIPARSAAPSDEELWGLVPDPDTDPPGGEDAWLGGQPAAVVLAQAEAAAAARPVDALRPDSGIGGPGAGFAAGGPGDRMPPGQVLAGLTARAAGRLADLDDDELIGVARAWRRLSSWACAGELAAAAELAARRRAQVAAGADEHLAQHVADELAAALTMTSRGADLLVDFAQALVGLPATAAALARGDIDRARAAVIADETGCLSQLHARAVDAVLGPAARAMTTGQLRAEARRLALAADPAAADRRRQQGLKEARVEKWDERSGTAALAGRDLPPAEVLAADARLTALARDLKQAGAQGGMDVLRARVYTTLLLGHPLQALQARLLREAAGGQARTGAADHDRAREQGRAGASPAAGSSQTAGTGTSPAAGSSQAAGTGHADGGPFSPAAAALGAGAGGLPVTGSVNLTMPLGTWLGGGAPGEAAGFGPLPATDARTLARLAAAAPGSSWCLTLTGRDGRPLAHGCARVRGSRSSRGLDSDGSAVSWELTVTIRPLAVGTCSHPRESSSYQLPPALSHVISIRQRRCSFPGCRRPAVNCDKDHTVAFDQGGRTCECNCAPLCRRHHQAKQARGWHLGQPRPGTMIWTTPSGRRYHTRPDPYPDDQPGP
jgi:hypothetical protein